jgi:hypothetical protein
LSELTSRVQLHGPISRPALTAGLLIPTVENHGFRLNKLLEEGERVFAEIAWQPPNVEYRFHVGSCTFVVSNPAGEWIKPRVIGVSGLLSDELGKIAEGPPSSLFSASGTSLLKMGLLEKA